MKRISTLGTCRGKQPNLNEQLTIDYITTPNTKNAKRPSCHTTCHTTDPPNDMYNFITEMWDGSKKNVGEKAVFLPRNASFPAPELPPKKKEDTLIRSARRGFCGGL